MKITSLFHRPANYTTPEADLSPAEKASRKWDAREGEIIEQNYNLRRITAGLVLTIVVLAAALGYKTFSENYLVYVVETDIKTGEVRNVGTINQMENNKPDDQVYAYFIRQFVLNTRNLPLDEVVYKQQLRDAYAFLTKDGASLLNQYMNREKRVPGQQVVQANVTSVLPMEGGKSYQVRWQEITYARGVNTSDGRKVESYTGVFTVEHIKSEDKQQLQANPLGLYISDFRYEKDMTNNSDAKKNGGKTENRQNP